MDRNANKDGYSGWLEFIHDLFQPASQLKDNTERLKIKGKRILWRKAQKRQSKGPCVNCN
jgi:hypothetical protein